MSPSAVRRRAPFFMVLAALLALPPAAAQDSVVPAEVEGLSVSLQRPDLALTWSPVTQDATGQPELVDHYRVYRGTGPRFPEQFEFAGMSFVPNLVDPEAGEDATDHYYLVTAVDQAGNESGARPSAFISAPELSGFWTATTIELSWTDAAPAGEVAGYRVYWGPSSRTYRYWEDVGLATAYSLGGVEPNRNWYAAVAAVDAEGNLSPFSNEHVDALAGTIDLRVHDESRLCFGGCEAQEGEIVRNSGREIMRAGGVSRRGLGQRHADVHRRFAPVRRPDRAGQVRRATIPAGTPAAIPGTARPASTSCSTTASRRGPTATASRATWS